MRMLMDCNQVEKYWGTPRECNEKQDECKILQVGF